MSPENYITRCDSDSVQSMMYLKVLCQQVIKAILLQRILHVIVVLPGLYLETN
jgi:hypothetical protein